MATDIVVHCFQGKLQNIFALKSNKRTMRVFEINYDGPANGLYSHTVKAIDLGGAPSFPARNQIVMDIKQHIKDRL